MSRQTQSRLRRFFASRLFLLSALAAAIILAFCFGRAYYQDYKVRREINNLQDQAKKLEAKKLESMEILKYVTSPSFVEEKARTELNMKKPEEQVLIVNDLGKNEGTKSAPAENQTENLNNPVKWWRYFTHQTINN